MPTIEHLQRRRAQLLARVREPVLLFSGGERPRNLPENFYPTRLDSNFLFFFANREPDSAAFFDPDDGTVSLFLADRSVESSLWSGSVPGFGEIERAEGVDRVLPVENLEESVSSFARGRKIQSLAVADSRTTQRARRITGVKLDFFDPEGIGPFELQDALADLRLHKEEPELAEMRRAAEITAEAFADAMHRTRPGAREHELNGAVEGRFAGGGGTAAFPTILTRRGEVLHNHRHDGVLEEGDLVLMDAGAEVASGYASDVTRTWPATGTFSPEARAVYEIVLRGQKEAVLAARSGVRFRDLHLRAAELLAGGLVELGLLRGSPADLVERGAHALFFPHGLGHFLGLDAHDLESFGDRVLYGGGRRRSAQFGIASLRIDRDLEPGMVVTIEPGIYFAPAILRHTEFREEFADAVDFERAEDYLAMNGGRGFGGIRIEDDVVVTGAEPENLTAAIPKELGELEEIVGRTAARTRAS